MTVITHTEQAQAVARLTGFDLDEYAVDHDWSGVGLGPVGQHRDSDALDRSNYAVILADLTERFPGAISDVRFGHWAVGWVEEITHDAGNAAVVEAVQQWRDALDDYPVADDDAHSALEYSEAVEFLPDLLPNYVERDGAEYELRENLPEDYAGELFSYLFDTFSHCRIEDYREDDVIEAGFALDLYGPVR
jgi:hypothetical protein